MPDIDLLFISNGHGEDAIAALLADRLPGHRIAALPLVGEGRPYRASGVPVMGPATALPSGGWGLRDPRRWAKDLAAGAVGQFLGMLAAARTSGAALAVAVGDLLPVLVAAQAGLPCVLVGCNKTDWYSSWGESYLAIEVAALKAWQVPVFARDGLTQGRLAMLGVAGQFVGNALVDLAGPLPPPADALALLPGSRADAALHLPLMLEAAALTGRPAHVAIAPGREDLRALAIAAGASVGDLQAALAPAGIALATAGTASEVAAAHGRPIVAFAGPGPQYTKAFALRQKELLGPALTLVDRDPAAIARAAESLLSDRARREIAQGAARERIGIPGQADRVAAAIAAAVAQVR
ncbi:MAG: lipid-A-disaccharide synthase [Cyanobacteria bacterium REEB65]|nr:lipid-A-disaccharide synthase [Cyanobacteria bacterium REEB65]